MDLNQSNTGLILFQPPYFDCFIIGILSIITSLLCDFIIHQTQFYFNTHGLCSSRKNSAAVLLVLSERKTREEIILKLPDKTQESVIKAIDELERKYRRKFREKFKTITVDNGTEFLDYRGIEKSKIEPGKDRTKVYYAHPYSSWERGTNENINKLIRRFIPKGTDISKVSKAKIKSIERWINEYPRRMFGYRSAIEMAVYT